ncbi:MAG: hypothetical protein ACKVY0_21565 [Prosthecobacter sp.]|uniref:hypothetical protein n=1 Tax=Prosthecobacter sp. TaxID=1965333 RepID=UPI0038FF6B22
MSTVADITSALSQLDIQGLLEVEGRLHSLQREKSTGVIFDDDYGVWTMEDQASAAAEAFAVLDADEA